MIETIIVGCLWGVFVSVVTGGLLRVFFDAFEKTHPRMEEPELSQESTITREIQTLVERKHHGV